MTKSTNVNRLEMEENYLTVSEVMRYLKISRSGAYALTRRKDFPVCLIGGSIRVPESLFLTWLKVPQLSTSGILSHRPCHR